MHFLWLLCVSSNAPDGGKREGGESQFTPTITTIAARTHSWLDRGWDTGVALDGQEIGFTQPSLWKYSRGQWLWDSGAVAISNSWRNATRSALEVRTLLRAQQPDGRVPEQVDWPAGSGNHKTQMPVLPWTIQCIFQQTNDTAVLREFVPPLVKYWDWWRTTRDIDGDGLVTILHPWESGIDISPAYDAAWHVENVSDLPPDEAWLRIYPMLDELQGVYKEVYKWNQTEILARKTAPPSARANWFAVQDVGVNTLYAVGWAVLGDLASAYGDSALAARCQAQNVLAERAIHDRMWKPAPLSRFVTTYRDRDGSQKFSAVQAVQTLWPLLLRSLTAEQRTALVAGCLQLAACSLQLAMDDAQHKPTRRPSSSSSSS
jgi:hypothetical protein